MENTEKTAQLEAELKEIKALLLEVLDRTSAPREIVPSLDRFEAAKHLGVSPGTIDNLVKSGQLRPFYVGAAKRFEFDELLRYIDANRVVKKSSGTPPAA